MKKEHKKMRRLASLLLAAAILLGCCTLPALAAEDKEDRVVISTSLDSEDNDFRENMILTLQVLGVIPMNAYRVIGSDTELTVTAMSDDPDYFGWVNHAWLEKDSNGFYKECEECGVFGCSLRENGSFLNRSIPEEDGASEGQALRKLAPGESVTFTGEDLLENHEIDLANAICLIEVGDVYPENGELRDHRSLYLYKLDDQTAAELGEKKTTPAETGNPFKDVPADAYFHDAVLWALEKNITTGMTDTTFGPTATCTRGQVATFLWRAKGCPEPKTAENPFTDVKKSDYYYKAILWAYENGITTGTSETAFTPSGTCTSAQVVTFLWRANGKPSAEHTGAEYYAEAVAWANANNLLDGTATPFTPSAPSPRADIVTYLYRDMGA